MSEKNQRLILGASCVVFRGDKVLLVERGQNPGKGLWSLPGGKVEFGETVEASAVREVFEETGLAVEIIRLIGIYEIISSELHFSISCFLAEAVDQNLKVGSDAAKLGYFDQVEVSQLSLAPNTLQAITDARRLT
jgi:8-oxo-dGTP diphosphatase